MKNVILLTLTMFLVSVGYAQTKYPIKTIFKGDSVVILSVQQSEQINSAIGKAMRSTVELKELREKIQTKDSEIEKLKLALSDQNMIIDSLTKVLLEQLNQESLEDSLWKWSLGPTLIYTQYPEDSVVYLMDLSHYYMTTDDFGIVMVRMTDREYAKYVEFNEKYGLSEEAFWQFRTDMRIEKMPDNVMQERKVWKYKRKEKK